ncbi:MAG: hypothetical protein RLZZ524_684 [Pseudomonadota bacterium]
MPTSVVAAIAANAFTTAVVAEFAITSAFAAAAINATASFVVGSALRGALGGGAEEAAPAAFAQAAQARTHVVRTAVANRTIVYGRAMVSGPLVYASTFDANSLSNSVLNLCIPLAGHECDAVEEIYFNDELLGARDAAGEVQEGTYANVATVVVYLGSATQAASTITQDANWTANHRLQGVTYLMVQLVYSREIYPRGIPNIKAVIRGKKLYDPRTGLTVWSDNWALACRDYLTSDLGMRCTSAEIDDTAITAAANIADEAVALAAGGNEARYTCNAVLDTGSTPRANMEALLSAGAGTLTWPAGLYTLNAGAYVTPTITLDEDSLRGAIRVRARPGRKDLYNAIKGTFVDPEQHWQPIDFPPLTNATYETQDGDQRIWRDVAYPATTSSATAQRLAKIALEKSRQGITIDMPCNLTAFPVRVWDNVMVTIDHLAWSSKVFKVTGWALSDSGGVDLTLQEEASACYTWSAEETIADPAPDTNLPDPFIVTAPGTPDVAESLFETTGSAGVKARAVMSWAATADPFVVDYLPEYRIAAGTWVVLPAATGLTAEINDIAPGDYEFRLRARNAIGQISAYGGTRSATIRGLTAAPADVTGFSVIKSGGFALAAWAQHADLDVRQGGNIIIRHNPAISGATWEASYILEAFNGSAINGSVPLITGTYLAKALDSSGNYSTNAVSFVATEGMVTGWTTVATSTQQTAFTGTKSNCAVVDGALRLDSASVISAMATPVSEWTRISGLGGISGSGSYAFDAVVDMTTVATRRFEADIDVISFDTGDLISFRDAVTTWASVSGTAVNDCDVTLYAATTNDDPTGSPTWSEWSPFFVADYTCRAAKFKLDLASGSATNNIAVSTLAVDIKVPA